jgi:hypothetical protein
MTVVESKAVIPDLPLNNSVLSTQDLLDVMLHCVWQGCVWQGHSFKQPSIKWMSIIEKFTSSTAMKFHRKLQKNI